jgi:predicted dehydrogenase
VGDEALLDLGPHLVDLARWLSGGEVTGVRSATLSQERAHIELELEHGHATLRCAADRPHRELVEARGENGELLARHSEGGLMAGLRARITSRGEPHPLVASLTAQLEAFAGAARGERVPTLATAADGHAVMAVIDAARACAAGGRPVELAVAA